MKAEHKIGFIALIYGVIASLVILIVVNWDNAVWTILGVAVAMFNYSQMLTAARIMKKSTLNVNILVRMGVALAVLAFAYFSTNQDFMALIYVLIGLIATKVGTILYMLVFKKKDDLLSLDTNEDKEEVETL